MLRRAFRSRFLQLVCAAGLFFTASLPIAAQEPAPGQEKAEPSNLGTWKLINTGIFAVLLGWFIAKNAPKFFNARSSDIQKAIQDATGLKIQADFRYSDADKKMAGLPAEVDRLRAEARLRQDREHERIREGTAHEVAHIQQSAQNEIDALRSEAQNRVQMHTAELALGLAERRLQDLFSHGEFRDATAELINLVERGKN